MLCVIFAAGLDWLEGLLPALFVGFWILSQVFAIFRRPANRGEQPRPVGGGRRPQPASSPPRRPPPTELLEDVRDENLDPGVPIEKPPRDRARLEQEIEDFLAGRRSGRSPASEQRQPSPDRPPERRQRRRGEPRRQRGSVKPPRNAEPPALPPPLPAPVVVDRPRPPASDTDVARHVDEAFAHDLAHEVPLMLDEKGIATSPHTKTSHASLAAMLRNPATIRQIIVMREVLERPTERWH
jgi:hypothetical protein